eukprot:TRINITY_DN32577_c0_g1_i1.p1 TRINITY_DN32577_c0_g1~~TRINITY_DN32577_c0_g1_i1.p1  ORF type:complete len:724 (+),score=230.92 TRINITY_DN32577_c0_g1_i1:140-2311(+)
MAAEGCGRVEETVIVLNSLHEAIGVDFEGITVVRCAVGSPAEKLTAACPFIVRKIGDFPISKVEDLQVAVHSIKTSGNLSFAIQYERAYRRYEIGLQSADQDLGLRFENLHHPDPREQTQITKVLGPAAVANVPVGCYLRKINNVAVDRGFEQAKQELYKGREQGLRVYVLSTEDTAVKPRNIDPSPKAASSAGGAVATGADLVSSFAAPPPAVLPADAAEVVKNQSFGRPMGGDRTLGPSSEEVWRGKTIPGGAPPPAAHHPPALRAPGAPSHPAQYQAEVVPDGGFAAGAVAGPRTVTLQLPAGVHLDPSLQALQHMHPDTPPQVITAVPLQCFTVPIMPPFEPSHDPKAQSLLTYFLEHPAGTWIPGDKFDMPGDEFFWNTFSQQCALDPTGAAQNPPFAVVRATGNGRRDLRVGAAFTQAFLAAWGVLMPHRVSAVHPGGVTEFRASDEFWGFACERMMEDAEGTAGGVLLHSSKEPWVQLSATMAQYDRAVMEWEAMKGVAQPARTHHMALRWKEQQAVEAHKQRLKTLAAQPPQSTPAAPTGKGGGDSPTAGARKLASAELNVARRSTLPAPDRGPGPAEAAPSSDRGAAEKEDAASAASPQRLAQARCVTCGSSRIELAAATAADVLTSRALPGPAAQRRALSASMQSSAPPPTALPDEGLRQQWLSHVQDEVAHALRRVYEGERGLAAAPSPAAPHKPAKHEWLNFVKGWEGCVP